MGITLRKILIGLSALSTLFFAAKTFSKYWKKPNPIKQEYTLQPNTPKPSNIPPVVGLTEVDAIVLLREQGLVYRVGERDGERQHTIMNIVPGRITLKVVQSKVVGFSVE